MKPFSKLFTTATLALSAVVLTLTAQPLVAAETYEVDATHSSVVFRITRLGYSHFYGMIGIKSGNVTLDEADLANSSIELTLDPGTVYTGNEKRDAHLRKPDFFNAKEFPEIKFKSTSIKKDGDDFDMTGELTLLGQTKTITAELEELGKGTGPQGEFRRAAEAEFTFKRSEFGMNYGMDGGMLSDEVKVTVVIEGVKK